MNSLSSPKPFLSLAPKTEEKRLIEAIQSAKLSSAASIRQILCVSTGRAQSADYLAACCPEAKVLVWYLDAHHASNARNQVESVRGEMPSNLEILCLADSPNFAFDLATLTLSVSGEAELARDFIQQLFHHLAIGGRLFVSVDNPSDTWVHDLLRGYEKKVRVYKYDDATVYSLNKTTELKKLKDYSCQLAFRDCDELIQLITRPGVFSHRQLDNGARQLLDAVDVYPEAKILEMGCGSGSVSLGLAKRDSTATIHAVDSNARAMDCLQRAMKINSISNISTELNHTGELQSMGSFDMVVANPPYYADFKIAEKFLTAAHRSLRSGGRLVVVTKQPNWYEDNLYRWFLDKEIFPSKRYFIASGVKA